MERVINLNTYQGKQALYRGYDIVKGNKIKAPWYRHLCKTLCTYFESL